MSPFGTGELNTILVFTTLFSDSFEFEGLIAYSCILLRLKCYEHVWGVWILWPNHFTKEQLQVSMFYQRKKASKFSNYWGNVKLGVYRYKAVNKNARFSLAKRLFIPNELLKTKGKILLSVTPM